MTTRAAKIIVSGRDQNASKTFKRITKAGGGMTSMFKKAAGAAALYFGSRAIIGFVTSSMRAYAQQIAAEVKLKTALKATKNAAGFTIDELKLFASQLQNVTNFGDEVTLTMMSILATFRNVTGKNFKIATMLIQDMSTALDQDLKGTALQVGKALNDPIKGIAALNRVGITFSQTQKDQIKNFQKAGDLISAQNVILDELKNQFEGQARAAIIADGGWTQFKNTFGDTKESIGEMIRKFLPGLTDGLKVGQVVLENFSTVSQLTWDIFKLGLISVGLETKHFFMVVIPDLLDWFLRNWKEVFTDYYNFNKTLWINMFKNVKDFFLALWSWVKGDGLDFKWTGLTEGFESSLKELPEIAKRQLSETEKTLIKGIDAAKLDLANKIVEKFNPQVDLSAGSLPTAPGSTAGPADKKKASKLAAREVRFLTLNLDRKKDPVAINTKRTADLLQELVKNQEQGGPVKRMPLWATNLLRTQSRMENASPRRVKQKREAAVMGGKYTQDLLAKMLTELQLIGRSTTAPSKIKVAGFQT